MKQSHLFDISVFGESDGITMGLEDTVRSLKNKRLNEGRDPVPSHLQGVDKEKIEKVLGKIGRNTPDMRDVVFALLDNETDSWFSRLSRTMKFSDGATTAHLGSHIGILQRSTGKLDREGRDYWIKPLTDLGAVEPVYAYTKEKRFLLGHPIPKSSSSAYRLSEDFKAILAAPDGEWEERLTEWSREANVRARAQYLAEALERTKQLIETKHVDLINACIEEYLPAFLPGYEVIFVDDADGIRISEDEKARLEEAGIEITLSDAMPDVLCWNRDQDSLWVIEAVTSDGEVDLRKVRQMEQLAQRFNKKSVGFTTAYRTWKEAAARQGRFQNIAPGTYIWIMEDLSRQFHVSEIKHILNQSRD